MSLREAIAPQQARCRSTAVVVLLRGKVERLRLRDARGQARDRGKPAGAPSRNPSLNVEVPVEFRDGFRNTGRMVAVMSVS